MCAGEFSGSQHGPCGVTMGSSSRLPASTRIPRGMRAGWRLAPKPLKELKPVADTEDHRASSLAERARSVLADGHIKQAAAVTKDVAALAEGASKTVSRRSP